MSSRQQFLLPNVTPGTRVRLDTASGSTSAADVVDNLNQPISGSVITADSSGRLASGDVYGPVGVTTLYMKTLDGSGNVTATTTLGSSHPSTTGGADPRVDTLLSGAPGALDTLKELADALNDDASFAATVTTLLAGKENVVVHGSTAGTARPAAATIVHWIGSVAPTNGVTNDEWTDTTVPVKKRYSGSAWVSLSGASSAAPPRVFIPLSLYNPGGALNPVGADIIIVPPTDTVLGISPTQTSDIVSVGAGGHVTDAGRLGGIYALAENVPAGKVIYVGGIAVTAWKIDGTQWINIQSSDALELTNANNWDSPGSFTTWAVSASFGSDLSLDTTGGIAAIQSAAGGVFQCAIYVGTVYITDPA